MGTTDIYRAEVNRLIAEQNLPDCPYDGKPCSNPNIGCYVGFFGVAGDDGSYCPRFKG